MGIVMYNLKLKVSIFFFLIVVGYVALAQSSGLTSIDNVNYMETSVALLTALKDGLDTQPARKTLESSSLVALQDELNTDALRYAFWINIYNAYIQVHLQANPEYYDDRRSFFKKPLVPIAGELMSFADIEHGIIRGGQFEYFLGYIRNPFIARYKKKLRPDDRDYRIHFALNCGAKSCPPVAIYKPATLDAQLDASSKLFLEKFSEYDATNKKVKTTALFSWFRGDFKGKKGVKRILKKYGVIPHEDVELEFDTYDWTLYLDNYLSE